MPVDAAKFLEAVRDFGRRMFVQALPDIELYEIADGRRGDVPVVLGVANTMLGLSWQGMNDAVALVTVCDEVDVIRLTLSVGATRSPTEYVLALLGACALADIWNVPVLDDSHFWGNTDVLQREAIAMTFKTTVGGFVDACQTIISRLEEQ